MERNPVVELKGVNVGLPKLLFARLNEGEVVLFKWSLTADFARVLRAVAGLEDEPCVVRGRVGYSLQPEHFYPQLTLFENLAFFSTLALSYCDSAVIYSVCSALDVDVYLSHKFGELPWRVKRRAGLCFSLISAAPILVWEEPTVGMSEEVKRRLFETVENEVKNTTRTLLVLSEDPDLLLLADRVFAVVEGEPVEMSPSEAAARWEEL